MILEVTRKKKGRGSRRERRSQDWKWEKERRVTVKETQERFE